MERIVVDTSVLLTGREPPPGIWVTSPEAAAEIKPGGKDASRFQHWLNSGMEIRSAGPNAVDRVQDEAMQAGNFGRLSDADLSLLALAFEGGILMTGDYTMLDIAKRLDVRTMPIADDIQETVDWKPRCKGCGRWFEAMPKDCPICGSEVALKRVDK